MGNHHSVWVYVKISAPESSYSPFRQSQSSCKCAEGYGGCSMDALTHATLSGIVTVRGRLGDFFFSTEPVSLKFSTQSE
ncbi:hypothetical protein TNCT_598321 [Trichonephila clavata]|uniref:Uncharacterized protein n=1 Tax=Trichonephila clavata TaxID=2740835 RepID=A0A8X6LTY3_TRICU|nr:hypothetical protein TNCT_598321 [Trichonephila clavata]